MKISQLLSIDLSDDDEEEIRSFRLNNVIKCSIPMIKDTGILTTRESADKEAHKRLMDHVTGLFKNEEVTVYIEGPIEESGDFVYYALVEFRI